MATVFKRKADRKRPGSKWIIAYVDENGKRVAETAYTDKAASEALARHRETEAAQRKRGVIDPKAEAYANHEARPLAEHLADWESDLLARGDTPAHARLYWVRASRLLAVVMGATFPDIAPERPTRKGRDAAEALMAKALKPARLSDLKPDRVQAALSRLRDEGRGLQTCQHVRAAVRAFSRWCHLTSRTRDDTLRGVKGFNVKHDRRHDRRALTADEAARLVTAAQSGPEALGMTGPDRAMLYRVALATGFRAAELRSLTRASFRLTQTPPIVVCEAGYTKNGQTAEQPIPEALARSLGAFLAGRDDAGPVFATMPRYKTAMMMRVDLDAAGIPYRDGGGRVVDFHSLRATYITEIVRGGASVKVAQTLARHSTPVLTIGLYAHAALHDQTAALEALPDLTTPSPRTEALAATGTDSVTGDCQKSAAPAQRADGGRGRDVAVIGLHEGACDRLSLGRKSKALSPLCAPSRGETELRPVGLEPTTDGLENRCSIH